MPPIEYSTAADRVAPVDHAADGAEAHRSCLGHPPMPVWAGSKLGRPAFGGVGRYGGANLLDIGIERSVLPQRA
jgi:hypothetical protein